MGQAEQAVSANGYNKQPWNFIQVTALALYKSTKIHWPCTHTSFSFNARLLFHSCIIITTIAMFSPSLDKPAPASGRSTRRRQRPSNDSIIAQQPKAKRQRSALSDATFQPPNATNDSALEIEEVKSNKVPTVARRTFSRNVSDGPGQSGQVRDIVVRGKKPKHGDRAGKGDGSVTLVCSILKL